MMNHQAILNVDPSEDLISILNILGLNHFKLSTHKILGIDYINKVLSQEEFELIYHYKRHDCEEITHQITAKVKDVPCYIFLNKGWNGDGELIFTPYVYSDIKDAEIAEKWFNENVEPFLKDTIDGSRSYFSLLCRNSNGPFLKAMPLKINIAKFLEEGYISNNYGYSFVEKSNRIVDSIRSNYRGIYIFNGEPGTGKSSYIRYLLSTIRDVNFIWVPAKLIEILADPDFIAFFATECSDSVFIIEDAEKIVENINGRCDTLLNLGDGILSDAISSQIILTFNTDIHKIDQAIRRPGRLRFEHEFKRLSLIESKVLAESIGLNPDDIREPKTLAEIYEAKPECSNDSKKGQIGFKQRDMPKKENKGIYFDGHESRDIVCDDKMIEDLRNGRPVILGS